LPVIGPRRGAAVGAVMAGARSGEWRLLDDGRLAVGGVELEPDEFQLTARARPGHEVAEEGDLLVALDTALSDELEAEGLAREVAHRLQNLRRTAGYEISDRVVAWIHGDERLLAQLTAHREWLATEILATELHLGDGEPADGADARDTLEDGGRSVQLALRRV
jgi:isoleucyl-tRNA synthetase